MPSAERLKESDGATMTQWLKSNVSTVCSWAALIAVAVIVFGASRGTALGQLGVGLLTAAIALFVVIVLFELIWRATARWLDSADDKAAAERPPKHRQRGQ
jgi:divalent metal cation (Fe/Co/Zn/Cd) transporter